MNYILRNKNIILILLATLLGGLLRFWKLGDYPVSLNWDEVSHGYNAYSLLLSGKDEWGKSFPLIFRAFGDFKLPLYIYASVLPVWLFGLNAFAVRFISALAGTLATPGIYLLVRELDFRSQSSTKTYPLISAFLLAILPWHFFISRPALEANLSLTLIIFGFYYLIKFFKTGTSLLPAVIVLGLSLHTYNTARIFVPLLVIATFLIYKPKIVHGGKTVLAFLLVTLFSGLVIYQVLVGEGTARYEKLKILSPATVFQIGENRAHSSLPPFLAKAVHNRPVFLVSTVTQNYLKYFSPSFFSQKWGAQFQFAIPGVNLLTVPVFILAILGLFYCLKQLTITSSAKDFKMLLAWLLLSPLAASLTIDPPQALRPNPMIPAVVIFSVLGLGYLLSVIPQKLRFISTLVIGFGTISLFASYLINYTGDYKTKYAQSWQYGYREVMDYVKQHHGEYDKIFITKRYGEPHLFYSFYTALQPNKIQPGGDNLRYSKSDWYWTDKIGEVYFINDWQIPTTTVESLPLESGGEVSTKKSLLITSPDHVPVNAHFINNINFLDGSPAFIITSVP